MPLRITNPDPKQLQRLLHGLPPAAVEELSNTSRQVTYRPGETIMAGDDKVSPGIVIDGTVRLIVRAHDGREAMLRALGRGDMFGLTTLFGPPRSLPPVERSILSVDRSTVVMFDPAVFLRFGQRYCEFSMQMAHDLASSASMVSDAAGQFAFMSVRQRVAGYLLRIAAPDSSGALVAPVTQQHVANAVGSVREVVARTLHDMRSDGLISVSRARVTIVDRDGLMRTAFDVP